jgi:hypothetical protein
MSFKNSIPAHQLSKGTNEQLKGLDEHLEVDTGGSEDERNK